eukprot:10913274-Heterocapsa_arctica.AAC.1
MDTAILFICPSHVLLNLVLLDSFVLTFSPSQLTVSLSLCAIISVLMIAKKGNSETISAFMLP